MIRLMSILLALTLSAAIPVKEQLSEIRKHFNVQLVYDAGIGKSLRKNGKGKVDLSRSLSYNLDEVLSGTGISWIMDGRYVILKAESGKSRPIPRNDSPAAEPVNQNLSLEEARITSFRDIGIHSARPGSMELPQSAIKSSLVVLGESDVLKTLQLMPGIQAGMEGFSGIYVRGGGPDENLVLLDGIPIYNTNHLFGLFSAFIPEAVSKVNVYTGSFPARYGGRASSVIDVRTNDGNETELKGSIGIGLLSDKLHLEGPIGNGRTTFSVSARALHTFLISPVMAFRSDKLNYLFYDLNGKISHNFSGRDRMSLSIYDGKDNFRYRDWDYSESIAYKESDYRPYIVKSTDEMDIRAKYGNTVAVLKHTHIWGNRLSSDAVAAWNRYGMSMFQKSSGRSFDFTSGIRDVTLKDDFEWSLSNSNTVNFGGECVFHRFMPGKSVITVSEGVENDFVGQETAGYESSLYASGSFSFSDRLSADAGARLTWFRARRTNYLNFQPRLALRYIACDDMSIKASYSRMSQPMHLLSTGSMSLPTDSWVPVTKNIKPETSDILSLGTYYTGMDGWEMSVEGYYKSLSNVIDYIDGKTVFQTGEGWEDSVSMGNGRSYGTELTVRKTAGNTTGSLAYTLSWSDRIFPDGRINRGNWFPYQYDRRHSIVFCLAHRFNERIDVSGLWVFNSGNCMTVPEKMTEIIFPERTSEEGFSHLEVYHISSRNNYRLPPSHRLDVSANFRKQKKRGERVWTVGIYNMYNAMNPNWVVVDYDEVRSDPGTFHTCLSMRTFLTALPFFSYTFNF